MNKYINRQMTVLITLLFSILLAACSGPANEKKIGIIVPIEHKALNEIIAGFTDTLRAQSPYPVKIKVANAQGDMNMQRAIIQQMKDENYDIVVPVSTTTTQMTVATIKQQPIVSIAATFSQEDRNKLKSCHVAVVNDEIPPEQIIKFIHLVYPKMTKITLVHSTSDKIFPQAKAIIAAGKKLGIDITPMLVPTLNELYSTANAIPADTQGILILKDSLIASGIATLELSAEKHHVPLMTSDQGSVEDGAAFSIGVHEREIGVEGAKLATAILAGKSACDLPIVNMTKLTVFVNKASLEKEKQSITPIQHAAEQAEYAVEIVNSTTEK